MKTVEFEDVMEVVELRPNGRNRHVREVYLSRANKAALPNILNISPDLAEKLPWVNNERLNFLAKKDGALFGLTPYRTGLVTLKATGNNYRINNTDLCTTIRARCAKAGYDGITSFRAWIADDILMFAPKDDADE